MSVVRSEYTDNYGTHPFDFYVDNEKWALFNTASTLFSGIITSVQAAQDAISSICGSAALTIPIPLVESGTNIDEVMSILGAVFPNSYYVDSPNFDGNPHFEPITVGQLSNKFSLCVKGSYNQFSGVDKLALNTGSFANLNSSGAEGGNYIGLGVLLATNEHYDGQFNLRLSPALSTSIFDVENMSFTSRLNNTYPNNIAIRWYTKQTGSTNFWIYGRYNRSAGVFLQGLQLDEREEPTPPGPSEDDPYGPNPGGPGYSGAGGGPAPTGGTGTTGNGGLHDDTSDAVPIPTLPSDVVTGSALFTAYNPSASQLASFANALWNMQPTDINDVLRFLFGGDAFNAIIGLHLLPVAPSTGGSQSIKLGNWDTGVSAPKISNQYAQVPFGSLLLPEYWGNCIDYAPYTKIQLALPYIGIVDVDTDDVLGSTNTLTYNIDVLSGAICATLHCAKFNLSSVIYQWSGACAVSLPFSGASYNSVLGAIAGIAAAGMGFASIAAGPIGAALPAAALAAGGGAFGAGSAASIMGTMKGKVQKSGSFGANSGALGIMTPYFILTRPVQSVPETWQADKGYPSNISAQLGTLTGYTEVSEINLECSGTEAEKKEIIDLLKKGVLF